MIDKFRGEYAFLSNFSSRKAWPIVYDGLTFSSVEAAYQAQKYKDPAEKEKFTHYPAYIAKRAGKKKKGLREDWDEVKLDIMTDLIKYKFNYPPYLESLLSTYPEELIEGNSWHDNYWGNCTCEECKDIPGENYLGKILMKIRDDEIEKRKKKKF